LYQKLKIVRNNFADIKTVFVHLLLKSITFACGFLL